MPCGIGLHLAWPLYAEGLLAYLLRGIYKNICLMKLVYDSYLIMYKMLRNAARRLGRT